MSAQWAMKSGGASERGVGRPRDRRSTGLKNEKEGENPVAYMRAEAGMVAPVEGVMEEGVREMILARWTWSCCWEWSYERKG